MAEGQTVSESENSPWAPLLAALKMKTAVLSEGWIAADYDGSCSIVRQQRPA